MNKIKRVLCMLLVLTMLAAMPVLSAGAAGIVAEGAAEVSASALNLRAGTGTDTAVVTVIPNGAVVVVIDKTTSAWYQVNYNGTEGYVSSDYLTGFSESADLDLTGKVNATSVRYRDGASTGSNALGTLAKNEDVAVTGIENGWYSLNINGTTVYMRSDYVTITGKGYGSSGSSTGSTSGSDSASGTSGKVTGNYVNFRTGPSTGYDVIDVLSKGTAVTVLDETSGWYKMVWNGITGYMSSLYVSKNSGNTDTSDSDDSDSAEETTEQTGTVTGNYVNFRTGPSTSYDVLDMLNKGAEVDVLGKTGGWYKIRYNGYTGYMSADYVKVEGNDSDDDSSSGSDKASDCAAGSVSLYSASDLKYKGTFYWNGYRWTWYSEKVLPGTGLNIPGRHVDDDGYVCDGDGYIVIASSTLSKGTVVATPLGKDGKVYDYCGTANTLDVYVSW